MSEKTNDSHICSRLWRTRNKSFKRRVILTERGWFVLVSQNVMRPVLNSMSFHSRASISPLRAPVSTKNSTTSAYFSQPAARKKFSTLLSSSRVMKRTRELRMVSVLTDGARSDRCPRSHAKFRMLRKVAFITCRVLAEYPASRLASTNLCMQGC